jgi:hypothetical protein
MRVWKRASREAYSLSRYQTALWDGPPSPQPTPASAAGGSFFGDPQHGLPGCGSWGTRADLGVRPTHSGR